MIVNKEGITGDLRNIKHFCFDECDYYLHGNLFCLNHDSELESIKWIHEQYKQTGVVPYEAMMGSFSCIMQGKDGKVYAFTDNSNMHCLYYSSSEISTSFLELIEYKVQNKCELFFDEKSVCEMMTLGRFYFDKTLVQGIGTSLSDKVYYFQSGMVHSSSKKISNIGAKSWIKTEFDFLQDISLSLKDKKKVQALTGGYDSRMVYVCMKKDKQVQLFISGDNDANEDIVISQKIASITGDPIYVHRTPKPDFFNLPDIIEKMFQYVDGMFPFLDAGTYRLFDFVSYFSNQGYEMIITGDGGVLHKDWEWMQDLPFYNKKKTNLERFFRQRIEIIEQNKNIGARLSKIYELQSKCIVEKMQKYVRESNTKSYDILYYYVTGNRSSRYTASYNNTWLYAPLNEFEVVKYSYNLPRFKRFFYNNMRDNTTQANKSVARVATGYGTTASSEARYIFRDIWFQLQDYGRKAIRLLRRKILNSNESKEQLLTWSFRECITDLNIIKEAIEYLKCEQILKENVFVESMTDMEISAATLLFLLHKKYGIEFVK